MSSSYSNDTSQVSCSDCKLEIWQDLLLNWLNKCVHPKSPVNKLNKTSLLAILNKYKYDISDKIMLKQFPNSEENVEKFINFKYPLLKFYNVTDSRENYKKTYIFTTLLLYHCCVHSIDGRVGHDICAYLNRNDQETILRFCERLGSMDITSNNVEAALSYATAARSYKKSRTPWLKHRNKPLMIYSEESSVTLNSLRGPNKMKMSSAVVPSAVTLSDKLCLCPDQRPISVKPCPMYHNMDTQINEDSYLDVKEQTKKIEKAKKTEKDFEGNDSTDDVYVKQKVENTDKDFDENYLIDDISRCCMPGCTCTKCCPKKPCCGDPGGSMADCLDDNVPVEDDMTSCCLPGCTCSKCCPRNPCCGDPGGSVEDCMDKKSKKKKKKKRRTLWQKIKFCLKIFFIILLLLILLAGIAAIVFWQMPELMPDILKFSSNSGVTLRRLTEGDRIYYPNVYQCKNAVCQKIYRPTNETVYLSLSRCTLLCMGPQIWPFPIGFTFFSKNIVAISTSHLEYKIQSVPSESVHSYLAEAFKLFIGDLAKLEKMHIEDKSESKTKDLFIKKMNIQIDVETDADPRVRIDTDETYNLKIDLIKGILLINIISASFCGARHGLETLSQLILLDQTTGYLITLSNIIVRDAPSFKYRGLMIDTGRNYIPVPDLVRTIDAMATCKLNTFHWRITDVTSFPLYIPTLPQLFEYGAYDRKSVYTKDDIRAVVKRAGIRGIRVLMEVAAPGPVGRAWSWSSDASCPTKTANFTCSNVLCLRLAMREAVMDILQILYTEIIDLTKVDDIFHLSDSVFSLVNCYYLIEEREGFLDRALDRLKKANRGILPKMPIIWYTNHLAKDYEAKNWDRLGVQLSEWQPNPSDQFLSRFRVIHSSRWDLSCEMKKLRCRQYKTWQEMYSWKSWRNVEVFSIEGGEALLWTDLVDSSNLDYHLWPRAAAVAERLWSDVAVNGTAAPSVYVRLDSHRWRMLLKSVKVQPIWPMYCTFNPDKCIRQIRNQK